MALGRHVLGHGPIGGVTLGEARLSFSGMQDPELGLLLLGWVQGLCCPPGSPIPVWTALLCLHPIFEASANHWAHHALLSLQLRYMTFSSSLTPGLLPSTSSPSLPSMPHSSHVKEQRRL